MNLEYYVELSHWCNSAIYMGAVKVTFNIFLTDIFGILYFRLYYQGEMSSNGFSLNSKLPEKFLIRNFKLHLIDTEKMEKTLSVPVWIKIWRTKQYSACLIQIALSSLKISESLTRNCIPMHTRMNAMPNWFCQTNLTWHTQKWGHRASWLQHFNWNISCI